MQIKILEQFGAPLHYIKQEVLNTNYTCYPSFEQKIKLDGYHNEDAVVIDDKVITSKGLNLLWFCP